MASNCGRIMGWGVEGRYDVLARASVLVGDRALCTDALGKYAQNCILEDGHKKAPPVQNWPFLPDEEGGSSGGGACLLVGST